jgi:RimJ/RimL family protein N-acetyltransferase
VDGHVVLVPVAEHDIALLYRLTSDPAAAGEHEWFGWQDPWAYRRRWEENGLLGVDAGVLMVASGGERIGFVSWRRWQTGRASFSWNIGIALAPETRGKGFGSLAQRLLVRYLFAHTQVHRIEAGTGVSNIAEQRALEKAGFTREGVMRGAAFQGGRWHDAVIYSVLRDEVDLDADDVTG